MVVSRDENERQLTISTIGPFWDGNEVWLIVAAAAIFAAFPSWYASMFSAMYLVLVIILLALIVRGVSFEWRTKSNSPHWRRRFSWMLTIGSALIPLLFGIALGDLLYGLPINQDGNFTGNFFDLLTPYGLWVGLTMLTLVLAHGATFLDLKTTGDLQRRSRAAATVFPWIAALTVLVFAFWTHSLGSGGVLPAPIELAAFLAIVAAAWAARDGHAGWAFAATTIATACTVGSIFVELYPNVMVSSTNASYNLTVSGAASSDYALKIMTIVALVFTPLVLLYQGWNYYVFRARVGGRPAAEGRAVTQSP
jgi:cytochrome d ubiquinol oxidase subunit II